MTLSFPACLKVIKCRQFQITCKKVKTCGKSGLKIPTPSREVMLGFKLQGFTRF